MSSTRFYRVFETALSIPAEEISDSLSYAKHPKWDSTAHMMLIAELESAYDIMLDTDDIIDMSSVDKAKEILMKYDVDPTT